jgi:ligand-binding sensor domain-containing protein/serine phosphatase RsbU (regulator of sigma subunit)
MLKHISQLIICILCIASPAGWAQDRIVSFKHISANDGLANNNVNCFAQDSYGYIWIGTANGLSRYDGYSFQNYYVHRNDRQGLVSSNIQALYCDSLNNIWIGTASGGLSILDRMSGNMHAYHLLVHNARFNDVRAITRMKCGTVILGTNNGLYAATGSIGLLKLTSFRHLTESGNEAPETRINAFTTDRYGRIWAGAESGSLFLIAASVSEAGKYSITDFAELLKEPGQNTLYGIQDICATPDGSLWVATWGGGVQYFNISGQTDDELSYAITNRQRLLAPDSISIATGLAYFNGSINITTWNHGFVSHNIATGITSHWRNTEVRHPGLVTNDLFSVFADNAGNIWLGASRFGGVSIYTWKTRMVEHYELGAIAPSGSDRNRIYALGAGADGTVYIGGVGGMFKFHNSKLNFNDIYFPLTEAEKHDFKVLSVEYDQYRQKIWAGSDGLGLFEMDISTGTNKRHVFKPGCDNCLSNNSLHEIKMDSDGTVWVGSWGGGLDRYMPEKGLFNNYKLDTDDETNNVVLSITDDNYGNLWLATMGNGLVKFIKPEEKMEHQMITDRFGNIPQNYYYVFHDDSENIWGACLENGLVRYSTTTKKTTWFNAETGMEFGHISGIEPANDSTLLINTDKGVYILSSSGQIIDSYRFTDNLTPMTFWNASSLSDKLNWVYLAGDKGLLRYNPSNLSKDTTNARVQITDINLFSEKLLPAKKYGGRQLLSAPIEQTDEIIFSHSQNSLAFSYSAMDYTGSWSNIYRYRLRGFDKDWIQAGYLDRRAVYTNLPPGNYVFEIHTTNSDGIWSNDIKTINIRILSPFWHSLWFYFLCILCFMLGLSQFVKIRQRRLASRNKKLEEEIQRRTIELAGKNKELSETNSNLTKHTDLLNISNEQIRRQKLLLEQQHKEINQSIAYAQGLQRALLPKPEHVRRLFPESFVLFRPKEAISGDFYWIFGNGEVSVFLAADCTGHGIPGAMVSMLGISFFNTISRTDAVKTAGGIVNAVARLFSETFCAADETANAKDSMDLSVCVFNKRDKTISYCGILNPLYLARNGGQLEVYAAERVPLSCESVNRHYASINIDYKIGDVIYLFSDGFQDQFGGPEGKKLKARKFKSILSLISSESMAKQQRLLTEEFASWLFHGNSKRVYEQTDDVLVAGIKLTEDIFK